MSNLNGISNDSIAVNQLMIDRIPNIKREDLLDTKSHAKISFVLVEGMITDYRILKKRKVKR